MPNVKIEDVLFSYDQRKPPDAHKLVLIVYDGQEIMFPLHCMLEFVDGYRDETFLCDLGKRVTDEAALVTAKLAAKEGDGARP